MTKDRFSDLTRSDLINLILVQAEQIIKLEDTIAECVEAQNQQQGLLEKTKDKSRLKLLKNRHRLKN